MDTTRVHLVHLEYENDLKYEKNIKQAGAELCQAQHSLSLELDTN